MSTGKGPLYTLSLILLSFVVGILLSMPNMETKVRTMQMGTWKNIVSAVMEPVSKYVSIVLPSSLYYSQQRIFRGVAGLKTQAGFNTVNLSANGSESTTKLANGFLVLDTLETSNSNVITIEEKGNGKLSVLLIGDSMMGPGLGTALEYKLSKSGFMVTLHSVPATGLLRKDFFDWFSEIDELYTEKKYDIVIVMLGTNDAQHYETPKRVYYYGTNEWNQLYMDRVLSFTETLSKNSRKVYWVGMPPMRNEFFNKKMIAMSDMFRSTVQQFNGGVFIPMTSVLSERDGEFASFLSVNKKLLKVRSDDGVHISTDGARIATEFIYQFVTSDLSRATVQVGSLLSYL